ncbi:helix-turn-helix transcriptional regulator [Allosalinactinospora lopnorensis]|uniref:helix-turn-helix transcriptional regulator n=1 Tax=Allosalinactinospora lopnorensis TaxID=1352348 RepID=UPI0006974B53|nr:helix-turn-helix transcriptional regulator [Allosalinactinospora lopnorensis]
MAPETFPQMLKRHRTVRGWSQQRLTDVLCAESGRPTVTRQEVYRWESGRRVPRFWLPYLASVLDIPREELERATVLNEDDRDRIARSVAAPSRIDARTVEALAEVLAAQRRLEDAVGPAAILPAARAQLDTVSGFAREARGPRHKSLLAVAAEWTQYTGWLLAAVRRDKEAVTMLGRAEEMADEAEAPTVGAVAVSFRGYVARQQGRFMGVVCLASCPAHS